MNQGAKIIHEMGEIVLELAHGGKFYIVFLQRGEMLGVSVPTWEVLRALRRAGASCFKPRRDEDDLMGGVGGLRE